MSKFRGRINKLFLKTHFHISNDELELIRDYLKAQVDDAGVSIDDFKNECEQLNKLFQNVTEKESSEIPEKMGKILKGNHLAHCAFLYKKTIEDCKKYPDGMWFPNSFLDNVPRLVQSAKKYFKSKKQSN